MKILRSITLSFFLLISIASCDFTSGLHKEVLRAQDSINNQEFLEAAQIYERILKRKVTKEIRLKIYFQISDLYSIYLADYEKAKGSLNKILDETNDPSWHIKALIKKGEIEFTNQKKFLDSLETYKKLTTFKPKLKDYKFFKFRLAKSYFSIENYTEADKIFKKLTETKTQEIVTDSYYYLGLSSYYRKDWDTAIDYWFEYLKREKNKSKVLSVKFLIANAYESAQKLKKAYNIYYSIIGEYPNQEVIQSRLNSLYERRVSRKR